MSDPDLDAVEARLHEVEAALQRVEDGRYGRCGSCGRPLEEERLADDPLANRCTECDPPLQASEES